MKTPEDLYTFLRNNNIAYRLHEHEPVFTVIEAEKAVGSLPGAHCKNLFLKDKKQQYFLVVALATTRVALKELANAYSAQKLHFASPDELQATLGVAPGSVTPFSLINSAASDVHVILDQGLFDYSLLNFHPLINSATVAIAIEDFNRFLQLTGNKIAMHLF